jgi:putative tricarboxylic transport membrane protein
VNEGEKSGRFGQIGFGVGVVLLGALVAWLTTRIPVGPAYSAVGPRIFPWVVAASLVVIGLLVIFETLNAETEETRPEVDWGPLAWILGGLIAQLVLMEWAGFVIASTILFVAVARGFGGKRIVLEIVVGLVLCLVAYIGFTHGLGLSLPTGIAFQ